MNCFHDIGISFRMKHTEQTIKCSHQSVGVFVGGCNLTSKTTTVFMSHMRVVEIKLSMRLCDADSDDNPDNDKRPLSHCHIVFLFFLCLLLFFPQKIQILAASKLFVPINQVILRIF